jgi:hypothetical protein
MPSQAKYPSGFNHAVSGEISKRWREKDVEEGNVKTGEDGK